MTRVLVTGGSGFIGSHLVETLLRRGDDVTCLVRPTSDRKLLESLDVRLVVGDVTDSKSLSAAMVQICPDVVHHVAGRIAAWKSRQFFQDNTDGVRNMARACADCSSPPTLIIVTSLAGSGPAVHGRPRTEADTPEPISAYGRSKLAGERAARQFAQRVPITIVRPPIVVGPRDRSLLPIFRAVGRFGFFVTFGADDFQLAMIYVSDLVDALVLAAERGRRLPPDPDDDTGEGCYFVACDRTPSLADFGRLLAAPLGRRRVRIIHLRRRMAWLSGKSADWFARSMHRPLVFSSDKIKEALAGPWLCETDKAQEELGFAASTSLVQAIELTARWYREHRWV